MIGKILKFSFSPEEKRKLLECSSPNKNVTVSSFIRYIIDNDYRIYILNEYFEFSEEYKKNIIKVINQRDIRNRRNKRTENVCIRFKEEEIKKLYELGKYFNVNLSPAEYIRARIEATYAKLNGDDI